MRHDADRIDAIPPPSTGWSDHDPVDPDDDLAALAADALRRMWTAQVRAEAAEVLARLRAAQAGVAVDDKVDDE